MGRRRFEEEEYQPPPERIVSSFGATEPGDDWRCPDGGVPTVRLTLAREHCPPKRAPKLNSPEKLYRFLVEEYGCEAQEWALVIGLTTDGKALGVQEVALGAFDATTVDPRVVFSGLLLMGATAFVFCHNHPSGSLEPSASDVALTRQLKDAGRLLSIRMLDHILVSGDGYASFLERGLF